MGLRPGIALLSRGRRIWWMGRRWYPRSDSRPLPRRHLSRGCPIKAQGGMFVEFFIRRPIFATVCALLIILGGAISIPTLPIALFPNLAPPQVTVTSIYTGANAQVVESAVTTPLEEQINGVEGMKYVTSTSGNDGTSTITATYERSEEHTSELQSRLHLVCRLLLEKKKKIIPLRAVTMMDY